MLQTNVKLLNGLLLSTILFASCSNSPEKAIQSMKDKSDEYMLRGVKPQVEMVIADCSDNFKKDFRDDIKWMSKLRVFEKELVEHLDHKELFDTTKHFPKCKLSYENCRAIISNKDSFYFYCKNEITIDDLVYKNDSSRRSTLYFLKDLNAIKLGATQPAISFVVDLPKVEFDKMKIMGMPKFDEMVDYQRPQPANIYFYNAKSNRFIEDFDFAKYLYVSMIKVQNNDTTIERTRDGNILSRLGTLIFDVNYKNQYYKLSSYWNLFTSDSDAIQKISKVAPADEYYVWDKNEDKINTGAYADKVSITGQLSDVVNLFGITFFIDGAKILGKEDVAFHLNTMKRVNFKTGQILK